MVLQEHVPLISAGKNIHKAYAAAICDLQDITHTFVFADAELFSISLRDDERAKSTKKTTPRSEFESESIA